MQSGLLPYTVVSERAEVIQLFTLEDESLQNSCNTLSGEDSFFYTPDTFASAALFQAAMTDNFNTMYDNGDIDPIDSMITVESVPDKCNILQQMTETTLRNLSDEIERYETLCKWVED